MIVSSSLPVQVRKTRIHLLASNSITLRPRQYSAALAGKPHPFTADPRFSLHLVPVKQAEYIHRQLDMALDGSPEQSVKLYYSAAMLGRSDRSPGFGLSAEARHKTPVLPKPRTYSLPYSLSSRVDQSLSLFFSIRCQSSADCAHAFSPSYHAAVAHRASRCDRRRHPVDACAATTRIFSMRI